MSADPLFQFECTIVTHKLGSIVTHLFERFVEPLKAVDQPRLEERLGRTHQCSPTHGRSARLLLPATTGTTGTTTTTTTTTAAAARCLSARK